MKFYIHAKFKNTAMALLPKEDTDILIEVDSKFRKFKNPKQCIKRFREIVATTSRLWDAGKPNQFYLLEAVAESDDGNITILKSWNYDGRND